MEKTFPNYSMKHLPGCIKTFRVSVHRCFKEELFHGTTSEVLNGTIETKRDQNYVIEISYKLRISKVYFRGCLNLYINSNETETP